MDFMTGLIFGSMSTIMLGGIIFILTGIKKSHLQEDIEKAIGQSFMRTTLDEEYFPQMRFLNKVMGLSKALIGAGVIGMIAFIILQNI